MADVWTKVGRKGRNQTPQQAAGPWLGVPEPVEVPSLSPASAQSVQHRAARLQQYTDQLLSTLQRAVSKQLHACAQQAAQAYERQGSSEESWSWSSIERLVVLGLGSPELSQPARVQMAFAQLLIASLLHYHPVEVWTCDPVFSEVDRALLQSLGWQVIEPAELQLRAAAPTMYFMPHCETSLLDSVLQANVHQLHHIAVLGNSFRKVVQTWHGRLSSSACSPRLPECLLVVARLVAEAEFCDDTIRTTGALNDLSMHLFPRSEYSWDDRPGET